MAEYNEQCLFCKLIRGQIPSASVYEDEHVFAFLDINPMNKGHVLVVPKHHSETIFDAHSDLGAALFTAIQRVGKAVMQATGAQGLNVIQNNYAAAGQEVAHVHWHLIPRHVDDGHKHWPQGRYADNSEMQAVAQAIQAAI